jgi:4-hydroxymandelate oxidase
MDELVNTLEFGAMAERQLGSATFALIAGSDRRAFDRMTLRPRMMVNTLSLDLTTELFGEKMFAPILVGPVSDQRRFHPEGELATVQGASAAKAVVVISSRSSCPLQQIVAQSQTTLWYQVYPEPDMRAVRTHIEKAVDLGCKAVCITVGAPYPPAEPENPSELPLMGNAGLDWSAIDQLRQALHVPVLLKGIMSPEEARTAVERGISGIVVSDHGGLVVSGLAAPIEMLPSIAEAVGGKAPILVDGGFRRGTDVLKGLALGAQAILLGRPPMWGLAAYGADGVQTLLKLLQAELARDMAMCGCVTVRDINRNLVAIHRR